MNIKGVRKGEREMCYYSKFFLVDMLVYFAWPVRWNGFATATITNYSATESMPKDLKHWMQDSSCYNWLDFLHSFIFF